MAIQRDDGETGCVMYLCRRVSTAWKTVRVGGEECLLPTCGFHAVELERIYQAQLVRPVLVPSPPWR